MPFLERGAPVWSRTRNEAGRPRLTFLGGSCHVIEAERCKLNIKYLTCDEGSQSAPFSSVSRSG